MISNNKGGEKTNPNCPNSKTQEFRMIIDGNVLCFSIHYKSQANSYSADQRRKIKKGSQREKCNDLKRNEFAGKIQGRGSNFQLSFIWLKLLCPVTGALQFQLRKWRMKESINLAEIHITGLCAKQKWNQCSQWNTGWGGGGNMLETAVY